MTIKGMNGENYNVTGQGQGNYNTVGASAGIASFLGLNAGNILGGGCYNRNMASGPVEVITSDDKPVSVMKQHDGQTGSKGWRDRLAESEHLHGSETC
jgi:hypothetical protein